MLSSEPLNKKQQEVFNSLIEQGGIHYFEDSVRNVVWLHNHCLLIDVDGTVEEI